MKRTIKAAAAVLTVFTDGAGGVIAQVIDNRVQSG